MDKLDSQILKAVQNEFPLSERPYEVMADNLKITSNELWDRLEKLTNDGVIRRIGVSINSHKFGFCSTLAAVSVQPELVDQAAEIIGRFPEVTHNYLRNNEFNIWFTVIAVDTERIAAVLDQIRRSLSLDTSEILNLPMKRLFKLNTYFNVSPSD
jgi:siroheme decarboxylase